MLEDEAAGSESVVVLFLGTRACRGAIQEACRGLPDRLTILVPADPELMGDVELSPPMKGGLQEVASILAENAEAQARGSLAREAEPLAGVFDRGKQAPGTEIEALVVGDLREGLASRTGTAGVIALASRDGLEILQDAGLDPAGAVDEAGMDLEIV